MEYEKEVDQSCTDGDTRISIKNLDFIKAGSEQAKKLEEFDELIRSLSKSGEHEYQYVDSMYGKWATTALKKHEHVEYNSKDGVFIWEGDD